MIYLSQLTIVTIVCNTTITTSTLLEILIEMSLTLGWTTHQNFIDLVSDWFLTSLQRENQYMIVSRNFELHN
jgi:hypothetical protein